MVLDKGIFKAGEKKNTEDQLPEEEEMEQIVKDLTAFWKLKCALLQTEVLEELRVAYIV